jgi:gliding motility-associated-like protein
MFTPNGDGYNDTFEIVGIEHCEDTYLVIKAPNGKKVFETKNYQNDWDAKDLPDGYYLYYFSYKINNIPDEMTGRILVRRN